MKKLLLGATAGFTLVASLAVAQLTTLNYAPQINPNDAFQDVVNGVPSPFNSYVTAALFGNYGMSLSGNNPENVLIGGDAETNLFQRGTTGASVTTTTTYGGPDRWAYWSGASTAMTVSQDSTAGDLPTGYKYAFKMARTSGQTGVVQVCMAQEVEGINSYAFAGQTAELDFHAITGSNFSSTTGVAAYIITGTGADEGIAKMAYGLNTGGGGGSAWTGQVNWAATVTPTTVNGRYSIAAPIPATATEIGVAICFTPVGTASTNDYVALSGIQLTRNTALTSLVASNASGTATALAVNDPRAKAFARRPSALETMLQQRYYYQLTEVTGPSAIAPCGAVSVTQCVAYLQFPTTMRIVPTMTYANGFATATTTAGSTLGACTTLRTSTVVTSNGATPQGVALDCVATTVPAAGSADVLYNNGGTGAIKASAEL